MKGLANKISILVIAALFAATFAVQAQGRERRIVLPSERMTVSDVFQEIRQQTSMGVAYRTDQIDPDRVVALPDRELTLGRIMEIVTEGSGLRGMIDDNVIIFVKETTEPPVLAAPKDDFVPTDMSNFRHSRGLRPRNDVDEGRDEVPLVLQETLVEIDLPMESLELPVAVAASCNARLPRFAVKTNLLYGLGTLTPNLSFEFGLGRRTSLEIGGSYNPWNYHGTVDSNRKLIHMIIKPEFRYWTCERFDGHFFGAHLLYGRYNIGTYQIPLLFDKPYRYDGHMIGAGLTYGYSWAFHKRWSAEFAIGAGVMYLKYDRYDCAVCSKDVEHLKKFYFGPTNAAINIVFLIR